MPFPEARRVIYNRNPLDRVICQLRFPPILRIESEPPSSFQEAIRSVFPMYTEKMELRINLPLLSKQQPPMGAIESLSRSSANKNYEFSTEDGICKVNLTRTFLSISTSNYRRWEDFKELLARPYDALIRFYSPAFFTRTGLRYIDIFKRSMLGLEETNWNELLKPFVLGLLSSPISPNVKNFESAYDISLSDNESSVRIVTSFVQEIATNEQCLMIDSDFFSSKRKDLDSSIPKLDFLNSRASRLIQWVITEKLHKAMEPQEI